ncbi:hypothetical protein WN48_00150 [Eufriesea mexicana]|uniref:Retrovirus-related Pol polyprotein from transposon TNT 1-94-like beta-barrel domain-containing protein n=1 Tax=Eufriesea mexicana TaxID=516756 RepID=A0A310SH03_9HYME|nr:hypothetical protein WN48_00150 [Eufriesea mexicana]
MPIDTNFFKYINTNDTNSVTIGNGKEIKVEDIGSGSLKCINMFNKERYINVEDVLYVPELHAQGICTKLK